MGRESPADGRAVTPGLWIRGRSGHLPPVGTRPGQSAGTMFWLLRKRFVGSYRRFTSASRW
jgi:hypothetical protein